MADSDTPPPGSLLDIEESEGGRPASPHAPIDPSKTKAVALEYDRELDNAPRVTASGRGAVAEQILAIAFEQGIKVRQDEDLVEVLSKIEIDSPIPLEAFAAVAEILSYVYNANACLKQNKWSQQAGDPLEEE